MMFASIVAGTIGFVGASRIGHPVAGVAVYWLGIVAFFGIWKRSDVSIQDERDCDLERRASLLTLQLIGALTVVTAPAIVVLEETSSYTAPAAFDELLLGYVVLFGTFGASYLWLRYRP